MELDLLESAELFAKGKHSKTTRTGCKYNQIEHLENVVNRLKWIDITDKEILCVGWLYETIEKTDTSFDELIEKFGTRAAVIVWALTGDKSLSKKQKEQELKKQLRQAPLEAKLIKLCDISGNLSDLKKQDASKSKIIRNIKQFRRYLAVIEKDIFENTDYPKSITLFHTVNQAMNQLAQRKNARRAKKES